VPRDERDATRIFDADYPDAVPNFGATRD